MTKSLSIRTVTKFFIPEGETTIQKANVPLGTISKSNKTFVLNREKYILYNCSFSKDYAENISVFIPELEDYKELDSYKKKINFLFYYNSNKNILFADTTTPITKSFLKALCSTPNVDVEYATPHFDLHQIASQLIETKGLGFNSDDEGVSSKNFFGTEVDSNQEAYYALEQDNSTKLMGVLEVIGKQYTIMFTQSGSLVAYSKIPTTDINGKNLENPMLSFSLDVLNEINFFS
ncbi:hypothetical protein KQH86_05715 [Weissella confusa]|uniref:hypothetical protein n=1 Tax=Weissella confusa TaxID=1583 RepID=UPI001C1011AC|nr:hypothetical protein [Weissella confusa]MBU5285588.1 hypothetical protein [Weissella confusa]MDY2529244.1 hypothetical protein [Weissella confusa]